jgi:Na+/H+ antiporter NhaD/arsenite permease-like protein
LIITTANFALGLNAGNVAQANYAIALGFNAGNTPQGNGSIAIGANTGFTNQGGFSVAIGKDAGEVNQGNSSIAIGLLSAIVDNVPLVAASMGMYDLSVYPTDHYLWEFLAYCAGTGGSILIIGSAAGVAAMGMEKIDFFNYLKKISLYALIGYFAGAFVYILMHDLH